MKRVAVIGAGYFGRFHYDAWSRMPEVALVATVVRNTASAQAVADEFGVPAVYDDLDRMLGEVKPDIVDITSPPDTHLGMIRKIARAGAAIQCQKPFCRSLDEAREATAAAADTVLAVHENFRFQPWHRVVKRLLDEGALGRVYQATFRLRPGDGQGPDAYLDRQPYFRTMERFLVHETAVHQIDLFRYFFGEPTGVFTRLKRLNPAIAGEDAGTILFEFGESVRATFDGNRLADHAAENTRRTMGEMEIEGSEATLRLDGNARLWQRPHGETEVPFDWRDHLFGGDCVYLTCRAFLDHVLTGVPLENDARRYLKNIEIEEAVYRSDKEQRWHDLGATD